MNYLEFLKTKVAVAPVSGFDIEKSQINPVMLPHQRDMVERIIARYSNPGELVGDFFAGLMTVPLMAIRMKRRGWGCELNTGYFRDGVDYLQEAESQRDVPTLFDLASCAQRGVCLRDDETGGQG